MKAQKTTLEYRLMNNAKAVCNALAKKKDEVKRLKKENEILRDENILRGKPLELFRRFLEDDKNHTQITKDMHASLTEILKPYLDRCSDNRGVSRTKDL